MLGNGRSKATLILPAAKCCLFSVYCNEYSPVLTSYEIVKAHLTSFFFDELVP